MVLRQSERERRALGPAPAFGGAAVRLRWDPDSGGWHSERQRPPLPAVTAPAPPAPDPVEGVTVARGPLRSPARPRLPLLVTLLGLALRAWRWRWAASA